MNDEIRRKCNECSENSFNEKFIIVAIKHKFKITLMTTLNLMDN